MYGFHRIGLNISRFTHSVLLFFVFLGHLCHTIKHILCGRLTISWFAIVKIVFYSGTLLVIPLIIISALMGVSLSLNTWHIFERFNLQHKALPISQDILIQELLPLLIAFVLCVQSSLHIISAHIKITRYSRSTEDVILGHLLPIIIGLNLSSLLLYTYLYTTILVSIYLAFHYVLNVSTQEYLIHIGHYITLHALFYSIIKTFVYSIVVSLTTSYYYYQIAIKQINLRKAVSRIFTRGSLWLVITSFLWKFMHF